MPDVRLARDDDWPAIREVHRSAFGEHGHDVTRLVDDLRAIHRRDLSFVSTVGDAVVGHVMHSWSTVGGTPLLQLSPLAVLPAHQGHGHGSALVRASLDAVQARGEPGLLVEGNPRYYGRFGFVRADELGLEPALEALVDLASQVVVFDESRLPRGQIVHPDPFTRDVVVRAVRPAELEATLDVERRAFGRDDEAEMVRAARGTDGHVAALDLLAVVDRRVVGHALTTWFGLEGSGRRVLELAPLAVVPEYQGRGIGGSLVRATLRAAATLGEPLVLVLGHRSYYPRFGFVPAATHGLSPPAGIPEDAFMVAVLEESAALPAGRVVFPPAFR